MAKVYKHGIDISTWQGNIDLRPYRDQFVIIRAGFDLTTDNKAVRNMDECERLGIPFGVYWYSYALDPVQARREAMTCLQVIKGRKISVGVWIDMEDADHWKKKHGFRFNRSNVSAICNAFCEVVEKAGYYTGIYASLSWMDSYIDCPKYDKWVASWGTNNGQLQNDTSAYGTLHQYTSKPLDKNVMYVPISTYTSGKEDVPDPEPAPKKTIDELAHEVIDGKWGVDDDRKRRLQEAGYDYYAVQARVNELLEHRKTVDELAQEVLDGKWGNGDDRKRRLTEAGYDYAAVQAKVNEILEKKKTVDQLAREVLDGKWGNGSERRKRLEAAGYDYDKVQARVNELVEGSGSDKMAKLFKACNDQCDWMYKSTYKWEQNPTVPKSKTKGTCVTYVACVLQRIGALKPGEWIYFENGKPYGTTKDMQIIYCNEKRPASLKGVLRKGDIVMHDDTKSGHIEIYAGEMSGAKARYYTGGCGSGHNTSKAYWNNRKILCIVRLKSYQ